MVFYISGGFLAVLFRRVLFHHRILLVVCVQCLLCLCYCFCGRMHVSEKASLRFLSRKLSDTDASERVKCPATASILFC